MSPLFNRSGPWWTNDYHSVPRILLLIYDSRSTSCPANTPHPYTLSSDMTGGDLATAAGVLVYLERTSFASSRVESLTGGFGNYTFRIYLREPYQGRTTLVVKHGKPYIPSMPSFAFSLDRQVRMSLRPNGIVFY